MKECIVPVYVILVPSTLNIQSTSWAKQLKLGIYIKEKQILIRLAAENHKHKTVSVVM